MKQRLKQQKRKLIFRISLIVLAAWLITSAGFCVICTQWLKSDAMSKVKDSLSLMTRRLSQWSVVDFGQNKLQRDLSVMKSDGQQAVYLFTYDYLNHKLADSNDTLPIQTGLDAGSGGLDILVNCYITRDRILNALSDEQRKQIMAYCESSDVPLVISRFWLDEWLSGELIPTELQTVRTDGDGNVTEVTGTYTLNPDFSVQDLETEQTVADIRSNGALEYIGTWENGTVIPTTFLLREDEDIIGQFDRYELYQMSGECEKHVGPFEYLMTAQTTGYLLTHTRNDELLNDPNTKVYVQDSKQYLLQYAERVNLWERGKAVLLFGTGALFVFFLIIAVLLMVLLWRMMKNEMVQEHRRAELSNALAHDIKTPLFVMSGYAESLRDNINNERRGEFAGKIMAQAEEVNALVRKMLDLGRLENSDLEPHLTEWDLAALAEELCGGFTAREITFTHTGSSTVSADRALMKRAVENLLDNAVKYSPEGSVVRVSVNGKTLAVANAGEEMDKAQLKEIWQPYMRRDKNHRQDGSGLGLSIVKSICDLHGFSCGAKQKDGEITFTVVCG